MPIPARACTARRTALKLKNKLIIPTKEKETEKEYTAILSQNRSKDQMDNKNPS